MATQVLSAIGCFKVQRATKAVSKGPIDRVMSTLATVVRVRAIMKAVNITDQHRPDNHNKRPALSIWANT